MNRHPYKVWMTPVSAMMACGLTAMRRVTCIIIGSGGHLVMWPLKYLIFRLVTYRVMTACGTLVNDMKMNIDW